MRVGPGGRKRFHVQKKIRHEKKILHFSLDSFTLLSLVSVFGRGLGLGSQLTPQTLLLSRAVWWKHQTMCRAHRARLWQRRVTQQQSLRTIELRGSTGASRMASL